MKGSSRELEAMARMPSDEARHHSHVERPFEEWGDLLGDEVMAAALLDRVLCRCHIVNIRGSS